MTAPSPELLEQAREIIAKYKNCEDWIEVAPEAAVSRCMNERVCECLLAAAEIITIGMAAGAEAEREAFAIICAEASAAARNELIAREKIVTDIEEQQFYKGREYEAMCLASRARSTNKQEQQR